MSDAEQVLAGLALTDEEINQAFRESDKPTRAAVEAQRAKLLPLVQAAVGMAKVGRREASDDRGKWCTGCAVYTTDYDAPLEHESHCPWAALDAALRPELVEGLQPRARP